MVEFLETTLVSAELRKLISKSKQRIYLISPYLQISKNLRLLIQQVDQTVPDIVIKIVCRKDKISADDLSFLQTLKSANISALENLHAKCYLNEETVIITSMNLYQYSQENNWEMGVKIEKKDDSDLYENVFLYVKNILSASEVITKIEMKKSDVYEAKSAQVINKEIPKKQPSIASKENVGHCIRCGIEMQFNPNKPLCSKCFSIWVKQSNTAYPEKYCHVCGKESKQSVEKPVCYTCYKKLYK
jgi:phosphatidylserine/phosphatidylglycerophosphate/cardiolipin synthase-like enzyme